MINFCSLQPDTAFGLPVQLFEDFGANWPAFLLIDLNGKKPMSALFICLKRESIHYREFIADNPL